MGGLLGILRVGMGRGRSEAGRLIGGVVFLSWGSGVKALRGMGIPREFFSIGSGEDAIVYC